MNQNQTDRPQKVRTALNLLYITLIIGVLLSIMIAPLFARVMSPGNMIFITFSGIGVMLFLIYKISKGRNWARIIFLVIFIVGAPGLFQAFLQSLAVNPIYGLLGIGQTVIQAVALVLLFQKPSSGWFREMKVNK